MPHVVAQEQIQKPPHQDFFEEEIKTIPLARAKSWAWHRGNFALGDVLVGFTETAGGQKHVKSTRHGAEFIYSLMINHDK